MVLCYLLGLYTLLFYMPIIHGQTVVISSINEVAQLEHLIPSSFIVTDCSYQSDVIFTADEFLYLTDLKENQTYTSHDIVQAITHLLRKNCFESITFSIEDDGVGKKLFFGLTGLWRFEKLKIGGIWVDRDWYKQYYLMEPGDPFDQDKHYHSREKIIEACKKDGFFNVSINDTYERDEKTKAVTVHLFIQRGRRFSIAESSLLLQIDEHMPSDQIHSIQHQLYKKFLQPHRIGKYSKTVLEQRAKEIKDFLGQRGFLLLTIDLTEQIIKKNNTVRLQWNITLGKKRNFVFFGGSFFSQKQLLNRILEFGRSAWIVPSSILAQELREMYHAKGFWQTTIEASDEEDRAIFVITEGKRNIIKKINIIGAQFIPESRLLKQCFNKVKKATFFDQQLCDQAIEKMIDYYNSHGFCDAKHIRNECIHLADGTYRLEVSVEEGEQLEVTTIDIPGFEEILRDPFFSKKKKTKFFNTLLIQEQKRWLADYFRKKGHLFASIEYEIAKMPDDTKQLIWHICPGQCTRFGKTFIQGVSVFPFSSIMRELQYNAGDKWDAQKVRQSLVQLKEKHIFDAVSFTPLSIASDQTERPVMLKFHKDDPFELRVRAGLEFQHIQQYQTFGGVTYKIGGTFLVKNPLNNGDYFQFDANTARSHRELQCTYFYPWLFRLPINGIMRAYGTRYEQPGFVGSKNDIYTIFSQGILAGVRYKERHTDLGCNIGFEVERTKVGDDIKTKEQASAFACAICFNQRLLDKRIPFFFAEPTLLIDYLDNNLNPTKGMMTLMSLKGMFPTAHIYANSYFLRLLIEHSWFVPLDKAVAAFRVRFGHIFHRCFEDILPSERFYLGGSHSVRSYEADLAPPLGCFVDKNNKKNIVPRGGKTMLNINVELRLPPINKMGFVVFQDMGLLSGNDFIDFKGENIVGGIGFGVRYFTPIGPLRFDIAWKWKKLFDAERSFNWYLTFGQAF